MSRPLVIVAVVLALLWQSLAFARADLVSGDRGDAAHAALHWQGQAHHHHDDGSYEVDDSNEALQHVLCDHACASLAFPAGGVHAFPVLGSASPPGTSDAAVPHPFLDGLLRPPRATA